MTIGVTAASRVPGTMMARVAAIMSRPGAAGRRGPDDRRGHGHRDAGDREQRAQGAPRSTRSAIRPPAQEPMAMAARAIPMTRVLVSRVARSRAPAAGGRRSRPPVHWPTRRTRARPPPSGQALGARSAPGWSPIDHGTARQAGRPRTGFSAGPVCGCRPARPPSPRRRGSAWRPRSVPPGCARRPGCRCRRTPASCCARSPDHRSIPARCRCSSVVRFRTRPAGPRPSRRACCHHRRTPRRTRPPFAAGAGCLVPTSTTLSTGSLVILELIFFRLVSFPSRRTSR